MLNKSTVIVFTIVYIISFHEDYKHRVSQANEFENDEAKPKKPTFRDLGKLHKHDQKQKPVTRPSYLQLVKQVYRLNATALKLKKKVFVQNETIFYKDKFLKSHQRQIRRHKDKIRTYKAQIRGLQNELIDKGLISDISFLVSEEKKGKKKYKIDIKELELSSDEILLTTPAPSNFTVQNTTAQNMAVQNTTVQNMAVQNTTLR